VAYHAREQSWGALIAHWASFARASLALPDTEEGSAMKRIVPDVVMLQSVWFALGDMDGLPADERLLGLDRAAVLIEKHERAIHLAFDPFGPLPEGLSSLIDDARSRLEAVVRGEVVGGEGEGELGDGGECH